MSQLPLPLAFDRRFSFENFLHQDGAYIESQLKACIEGVGEPIIGVCGAENSGKTHLLNACAYYARETGFHCQFFDAAQLITAKPGDFSSLTADSLIAVDNLQFMAGQRNWEKEFFHIVNLAKAGEIRFVFSIDQQPREVGFRLPDLKSRLYWGLMIQLQPVSEEELPAMLEFRAAKLGLHMSASVSRYLLAHYPRSISAQMDLLYRLERVALSQKKGITIPLIRQTLDE